MGVMGAGTLQQVVAAACVPQAQGGRVSSLCSKWSVVAWV